MRRVEKERTIPHASASDKKPGYLDEPADIISFDGVLQAIDRQRVRLTESQTSGVLGSLSIDVDRQTVGAVRRLLELRGIQFQDSGQGSQLHSYGVSRV